MGKLRERQCGGFANAFIVFLFSDVRSNSFIFGLFDCAAVACSPPVLLLLSASEDRTEGIRVSAS